MKNDRTETRNEEVELTEQELRALTAGWWGHQGQKPSGLQNGGFQPPVLKSFQSSPNIGVD